MNRYVLILLLVLAAIVMAQTGAQRITMPGATGMNSDVNPQNLRLTDAQYLLNTNVTKNPGIMLKRFGHVAYGTNARAISSGAALYEELTKWKSVVGVGHNTTFRVGDFWQVESADSSLTRIDSSVSVGLDSSIGQFLHSDKYGASLNDSMLVWWTRYDGNHDWTACDVGLVHAELYSPPAILSAVSSNSAYESAVDTIYIILDTVVDTVIFCDEWGWPMDQCDTTIDTAVTLGDTLIDTTKTVKVDTSVFDPHVGPLSPERPGVPRVAALNDLSVVGSGILGNLNGLYQYALAFKLPEDAAYQPDSTAAGGLVGPWISRLSESSMVVKVDSGAVILSCFPLWPAGKSGQGDSTAVIIYRRRVNDHDVMRPLDSILYIAGDTVVYLDNIADPLTLDAATHSYISDMWKPGEPGYVTRADTNRLQYDSSWTLSTKYWFAYSFLDTVADIESPLSPTSRAITSRDTAADGTIGMGRMRVPVTGGYDAVRIYRTTDGIDTIFYAVEDVPIQAEYSTVMYVYVGKIADTSLKQGSGVTTAAGVAITRPPYIYPLSSPFTDMEVWDDRLWGIGDPEFPSRLYRTDDEGFSSWNPLAGMYSLDEDDNDILIALERISIGSADALLAFKRRKTFIISGTTPTDVEFVDGSLWGTYGATDWSNDGDVTIGVLTHSGGALSRELVIKHRDAIYVVTNNLDVVRFSGTRMDTISKYVSNQFASIITDTGSSAPAGKGDRQQQTMPLWPSTPADYNSRAMLDKDEVLFINQATGYGMAWNVESGTWSVVKYSFAGIPRGTLKYDTVSSIELFGNDNDLFFFDDVAKPFYLQSNRLFTDTGTNSHYTLSYLSPDFGDGEHQWWLRSLQITYEGAGPTATLKVFNEDGDTLATSTFTMSASNVKDVNIGFGKHTGKSLSFEIAINSDSSFLAIYDIRPDLVKVGKVRIE